MISSPWPHRGLMGIGPRRRRLPAMARAFIDFARQGA
jgi:hypothetical protein